MSNLDIQFDGWSLATNADLAEARVQMSKVMRSTSGGAAQAFAGSATQARLEGLRITVSGTLAGTDQSDIRDKWSLIMEHLGGVDRNRFGRLDLYGDGHFWAQLEASPTFTPTGPQTASVLLQFFCADPYRRSASLVTKSSTPTSPNFEISLTHGSDFSGNVPRIPIRIDLGSGWQKDELVRVQNTTVGWIFEHVVTQDLTGLGLYIDGDRHQVLEAGEPVYEAVSGTSPWIVGGTANTLDFTDSDRIQSFQIEFYDRFWS